MTAHVGNEFPMCRCANVTLRWFAERKRHERRLRIGVAEEAVVRVETAVSHADDLILAPQIVSPRELRRD
jgi:hypothetical protein